MRNTIGSIVAATAWDRVIVVSGMTARQGGWGNTDEPFEPFRTAFFHAAIGMALVGLDGRWLQVNPAVSQITGYTADELHAMTFQAITHPGDLDVDLTYVNHLIAGDLNAYQMEKRYIHKDGHIVWVLLNVAIVRADDGSPMYFISQLQDIGERKWTDEVLRGRERAFRAIAESLSDVIIRMDENLRILYTNPAVARYGDANHDHYVGKSIADLGIPDETTAILRRAVRDVLHSRQEQPIEFGVHTIHGERTFQGRLIPERTEDGVVSGVLAFLRDITDEREIVEQLRYQAFHDSLTNLPNRSLFQDRLDHALVAAERRNTQVGLIYIDLDNFKRINDRFGHETGDRVLQVVAERLSVTARESDTVARLSGDEFVVLLEDLTDPAPIARVVERMQQILALPVQIGGRRIEVRASIGHAVSSATLRTGTTLLSHADASMYAAKDATRLVRSQKKDTP